MIMRNKIRHKNENNELDNLWLLFNLFFFLHFFINAVYVFVNSDDIYFGVLHFFLII